MTKNNPELSEKDFINEGYKKNPVPLWFWLFLLIAVSALLWGGSNWYSCKMDTLIQESPYLKVTNRELSLFLWQHPEYMRINAKNKNGYLPNFLYIDKITIDLPYVDAYATAPPEVLFRYHTWDRLIREEFVPRSIPKKEFQKFLGYVEEWQPVYWPEAPLDYKTTVAELASLKIEDLSTLSHAALPVSVRMAFMGWKNFFKEGESINKIVPTVKEMNAFLEVNPHYARNYWINLVLETNPHYLQVITDAQANPEENIIPSELASFLKVAFYNFKMANEERKESISGV